MVIKSITIVMDTIANFIGIGIDQSIVIIAIFSGCKSISIGVIFV